MSLLIRPDEQVRVTTWTHAIGYHGDAAGRDIVIVARPRRLHRRRVEVLDSQRTRIELQEAHRKITVRWEWRQWLAHCVVKGAVAGRKEHAPGGVERRGITGHPDSAIGAIRRNVEDQGLSQRCGVVTEQPTPIVVRLVGVA